jgi:hypothetical protein
MEKTNMKVVYSKPSELAKNIGDEWKNRNRIGNAMPYGRFQYDSSHTWWIVPATDRVAFRYAKIIVSSSPFISGPAKLFVGLYVEKGIGKKFAEIGYCSWDWVLKEDWRWHGILHDLKNDLFRKAMLRASQNLGEPLEFILNAHVPPGKKSSFKPPHDILSFETTDGHEIQLKRQPIVKTDEKFLKGLDRASNIPELAEMIESIPNNESVWVNIYIGQTFNTSTKKDSSTLNGNQLVEQLLEPFADWVT